MHERCWWHCCSLVAFVLIVALGIWTFSLGFLLSRVELHNKTSCAAKVAEEKFCHADLKPKFQRAVIIVVDALKHEFLASSTDFGERDAKSYENKVPIVGQLVRNHPKNAALFKFFADPPTTTMQRIKGITTGSLPTFIDISSNFAATSLKEDNIVSKARELGKNVTFMGDDTWTLLFNETFSTSYPFSSFDVRDLDTVDNGVVKHLLPEMGRPDPATLLIAHLLGVDHCGHRYGRDHPEMARKLREVNALIRDVLRELDDETILFVMGDHGMTKTGDHGGDSADEVEAALFVYSALPFIDVELLQSSVRQVDFAPTLSLLLGHPIPFSNLGQIIPSLLSDDKSQRNSTLQSSRLNTALRINADQIFTFLQQYSSVSADFDIISLNRLYHATHVESGATLETFQDFFHSAFSSCQAIWAKFDNRKIIAGLGLVGAAVLALLTIFLLTSGLSWISDLFTLFSIAISLFHFFSMFSNSFQVHEDAQVSMITQTFIVLHGVLTYQRGGKRSGLVLSGTLLLLLFIRAVEFVRRCREEQTDCSVSWLALNFSSIPRATPYFVLRLLVGLVPPLLVIGWSVALTDRLTRPGKSSAVAISLIYLGSTVGLAFKAFTDRTAWWEWVECWAIYAVVGALYVHFFLYPVFIQRLRPRMQAGLSKVNANRGRRSSSHSVHSTTEAGADGDPPPSDEVLEVEDCFQLSAQLFVLPLCLLWILWLEDTWAFSLLTVATGLRWRFGGAAAAPPVLVACWAVASWQLFFLTGHQTSFPTLHWNSALTGIGEGGDTAVAGTPLVQTVIMAGETFAGPIMAAAVWPHLLMHVDGGDAFWLQNPGLFWQRLWRGTLGYIFWHAAKLFFVMCNAAVNRRHLMVWKIFAPRYIFEACSFLMTASVVLLAFLYATRAFSATLTSVAALQVPLEPYILPTTTKRGTVKDPHPERGGSRKRR